MEFVPPLPVALTTEEQALWDQIRRADARGASGSEWTPVADAMQILMESLLKRKAIPEIRIRLFTDPSLAEKGARSPKLVFEGYGRRGTAIFRDGNFHKYLMHFVEGPDLPRPAIEGLCRIMNEDAGTSGMLMSQYKAHARDCVRRFDLDPRRAATEFFRLGIEIGMDKYDAEVLRRAAMSAR